MPREKANGPDSFRVAKCLPLASSCSQEKVVETMPVKTEPASCKPVVPILDKVPEVSWHVFVFFWGFVLFFFVGMH